MRWDDEVWRKAEPQIKGRGQGGEHFQAAAGATASKATRGKHSTGDGALAAWGRVLTQPRAKI